MPEATENTEPTDPVGPADEDDGAGEAASTDGGVWSGADAARDALSRAKDAAREAGLRPGQPAAARKGSSGSGGDWRSRGPVPSSDFSGPGPDRRDPQTIGDSVDFLVNQRRWNQSLSIGTVIASWTEVVGAEVAAHSTPERVDDGVLVVRADSTAWATQLRLLSTTITSRLADVVEGGVITTVKVLGPNAPSWKKGPRSVPGRGPRDTYG